MNTLGFYCTWLACASTVKYTTSLPCTSLSEIDSKLYINFELGKGKNHKHLENTLIHKAKQFMLKQSLHILEVIASSVQVSKLNMELSKFCFRT